MVNLYTEVDSINLIIRCYIHSPDLSLTPPYGTFNPFPTGHLWTLWYRAGTLTVASPPKMARNAKADRVLCPTL